MFDKIQSTYFKRVTTGVLALFMTASSGFSYAVPVYAEEVTTAAAKRKMEEEFSSTESSTLQLNENSTKEEVKNVRFIVQAAGIWRIKSHEDSEIFAQCRWVRRVCRNSAYRDGGPGYQ